LFIFFVGFEFDYAFYRYSQISIIEEWIRLTIVLLCIILILFRAKKKYWHWQSMLFEIYIFLVLPFYHRFYMYFLFETKNRWRKMDGGKRSRRIFFFSFSSLLTVANNSFFWQVKGEKRVVCWSAVSKFIYYIDMSSNNS